MKRIGFFAMMWMAGLQLSAQVTMRDVWLSMPDSLLPTLNHNLRLEHVDFMDMGVPSEVKNLLDGEGRMDTLTTHYASVRLNDSHLMQMRLLQRSDSTQVICLADTYYAPEAESTIRFFTTGWQPMEERFGIPNFSDAEQAMDLFFQKIDTLSDSEVLEFQKMIDPVMVSVSLLPGEETVILQLSEPFLLKDEKERLNAVLVQTKLKWDGNIFKECE